MEIDNAAEYLDYHAGFARMYEGEILQSDRRGDYASPPPHAQLAHLHRPFLPNVYHTH